MRGVKRATLLAGLILLSASVANAKPKDFHKLEISTASGNGGVMYVAPFMPGDYTIWFSRIDTAKHTVMDFKVVNTSIWKSTRLGEGVAALQLESLPAGHYVLRIMTTQTHWGECLAQNTVGFDVSAGKIAYLGVVDPAPALKAIMLETQRNGMGTATNAQPLRLVRENVVPPVFSLENAPKVDDLLAVAKANGYDSGVETVPIKTAHETFVREHDSDLFGYCH